jgi:menaquinone-dependent protoporphyrinogen oxidase
MKVLVSAASRHGSTTEVATAIADALRARGVDALLAAPDAVESLAGIDAAVIGSAIYLGRWLEPARDLVERHREALRRMPVWLFSSGPVGDPPKPADDPIDVPPLLALVNAREHRDFAGFVDRHRLGLAERAIMAAVRAPEGDFRPWAEIEAWAAGIADALETSRARS